MSKGIHHPAISTPDPERRIDFYTRFMDGEVAWRFGWPVGSAAADDDTGLTDSVAAAAMLKIGDTFLEVFEYAAPAQNSCACLRPVHKHCITHVCFGVTIIHNEYKRILAADIIFNCAPQSQDVSAMVYGRDPDGNIIELNEFNSPAHRIARSRLRRHKVEGRIAHGQNRQPRDANRL